MRARGLKLATAGSTAEILVVPHMGAWIEASVWQMGARDPKLCLIVVFVYRGSEQRSASGGGLFGKSPRRATPLTSAPNSCLMECKALLQKMQKKAKIFFPVILTSNGICRLSLWNHQSAIPNTKEHSASG